jgi:hypothetical protein
MVSRSHAKGVDVWRGYETDARKAIIAYVQKISSGIAKAEMAEKIIGAIYGTDMVNYETIKKTGLAEAVAKNGGKELSKEQKTEVMTAINKDYQKQLKEHRIDPTEQPNAFKETVSYFENRMRTTTNADRIVGFIRMFATLKYLALNLASPLVNLTTMFTSLPSAMAHDTKFKGTFKNDDGTETSIDIPAMKLRQVPMYITKALNAYVTFKWGDKGKLSPELLRMFDNVVNNGWARAQLNDEALMWLQSKGMRAYRKAINASMLFFSLSEQTNRIASIGAAFIYMSEQAKRQGSNMNNETVDALSHQAKVVSDFANGQYGDVAAPYLAQGDNISAHAIRAGYTFLKYPHTYLMQMNRLARAKNYRAATWMLVAPTILAGIGANPLYNIMLQPLLWLYKKLFGVDDPEQGFYDFLDANFNGSGEWIKEGLFDKTTGLSIKRSLAIEIPTVSSSIPVSLYKDIKNGVGSAFDKEWGRMGEAIAPRVINAPMRAYRESKEGITSKASAPKFYGKERIRPTVPQAIARGFGFTPLEISKKQEAQFRGTQIEKEYSARRSAINERYRKYYLRPAAERDKADLANIMKDVKKFNDRIKANGMTGSISRITYTSLQQARNVKPSKFERMRETREKQK